MHSYYNEQSKDYFQMYIYKLSGKYRVDLINSAKIIQEGVIVTKKIDTLLRTKVICLSMTKKEIIFLLILVLESHEDFSLLKKIVLNQFSLLLQKMC